jgi:hypothetical protein
VYKIGMTRRLNAEERVDELSGAAVPFHFDVHAMIYCEDAPALENMLHKRFEHRRVNLVNPVEKTCFGARPYSPSGRRHQSRNPFHRLAVSP